MQEWIQDSVKCRRGFATFEEADEYRKGLKEEKVRVRLRSDGTFDTLVFRKVTKDDKIQQPKAKEPEAAAPDSP